MSEPEPLREVLHCPHCGRQHLDRRWWKYNAHAEHVCAFKSCQGRWEEDHASIGVRIPASEKML